jgi:hypothetical protein
MSESVKAEEHFSRSRGDINRRGWIESQIIFRKIESLKVLPEGGTSKMKEKEADPGF